MLIIIKKGVPQKLYFIIKELKTYVLVEDLQTKEQVKIKDIENYVEYDSNDYEIYLINWSEVSVYERENFISKKLSVGDDALIKYNDGRELLAFNAQKNYEYDHANQRIIINNIQFNGENEIITFNINNTNINLLKIYKKIK